MLGPQTPTDKFLDAGLIYWLGPIRNSYGVDSEWLRLDFDQAGQVRDARIVTD